MTNRFQNVANLVCLLVTGVIIEFVSHYLGQIEGTG